MKNAAGFMDQFNFAVNEITVQHYRLLFLVNFTNTTKTEIISSIQNYQKAVTLNLNNELSAKLLEYSIRQRPALLGQLVEELLPVGYDLYFIDGIDVLFEPALKLDPLTLFKSLSRHRLLVIFWDGRFNDDNLYYAEPGYPEYRIYSVRDFQILEANASNDF